MEKMSRRRALPCSQTICVLLCVCGLLWSAVNGDGPPCICEEGDENCKCSGGYIKRSELSNFEYFSSAIEDKMHQLTKRVEMLEEVTRGDGNNMTLLATEVKNLQTRVDKLQEENMSLKDQLSQERRHRRSLEDGILSLDKKVNQTDGWLRNLNITGIDMQTLGKAINLLEKENLRKLAHVIGSYRVEVVDMKVKHFKNMSKLGEPQIIIYARNGSSDGNDDDDIRCESISQCIENVTTMFHRKIRDFEDRLLELSGNIILSQREIEKTSEKWHNQGREISNAIYNLNNSVITYKVLEQLIRDVADDILRTPTDFIGINPVAAMNVDLESLKQIFRSMLDKRIIVPKANIHFDESFYSDTYTLNPRLRSLIKGIKLLLGSSVIHVRADMVAMGNELKKLVPDVTPTFAMVEKLNVVRHQMDLLKTNQSNFERRYQRELEDIKKSANALNNRVIEAVFKIDSYVLEAKNNFSILLEEETEKILVRANQNLNAVRMELKESNGKIQQIDKRIKSFPARLNNLSAQNRKLRGVTDRLTEEVKTLKRRIDLIMRIAQNLPRNMSLYARLSDLEGIRNQIKDIRSEIYSQNDWNNLTSLKNRILQAELDIIELKRWKDSAESQLNKNNPNPNNPFWKYCSAITLEDPNLIVEDGKTTFQFPLGSVRRLGYLRPGTVLTFTCQFTHELYVLDGKRVLTCDETGHWDGQVPRCRKVGEDIMPKEYCSPIITDDPNLIVTDSKSISRVSLGNVQKMVFPTGTVLMFTCQSLHDDELHVIEGKTVLTCNETGHWDGEVPSCRKVGQETVTKKYCNPIFIEDQNLVVTDRKSFSRFSSANVHRLVFSKGTILMFTCQSTRDDELYEIVGKSILTCDENGRWDNEVPRCRKVNRGIGTKYCRRIHIEDPNLVVTDSKSISQFSLANVQKLDFPIGTVLVFTCQSPREDEVYRVVGRHILTCDENGRWDGEVPRCRKVNRGIKTKYCRRINIEDPNLVVTDSKSISQFSLANVQKLEFPVGTVLMFTCQSPRDDEVYGVVGKRILTCDENGRWDGEVPTCRRLIHGIEWSSSRTEIGSESATPSSSSGYLYSRPFGFLR